VVKREGKAAMARCGSSTRCWCYWFVFTVSERERDRQTDRERQRSRLVSAATVVRGVRIGGLFQPLDATDPPTLLSNMINFIAVPSVTRCRCCCCCCGHRFYIAIHEASPLSHAACAARRLRYSYAGSVRRDTSDTWWMVMRRAAARCGERA